MDTQYLFDFGESLQVFQLESSLKAKQDSVEKEMSDLNSRMTEARDENRREVCHEN